MCTITVTDLKKNFGKYNLLAQSEEIIVTSRGKVIYHIIPNKLALAKEWDKYFNSLPEDASFDDVDRE